MVVEIFSKDLAALTSGGHHNPRAHSLSSPSVKKTDDGMMPLMMWLRFEFECLPLDSCHNTFLQECLRAGLLP